MQIISLNSLYLDHRKNYGCPKVIQPALEKGGSGKDMLKLPQLVPESDWNPSETCSRICSLENPLVDTCRKHPDK